MMNDDKKFTKEKLKHLMAKSDFEAEDLVNLWVSNLFVFLFVGLKGARTQKEVFEEYIQRDPLDYDYKLIDDFYKQLNSYILAAQKIHREPLQTDIVKSDLENNPNLTPEEKQARIKAIEVVLANNQIASELILNEFTELKKFYEKYSKPPSKPDFKEVNQIADTINNIPIEKTIAKYQGSLFTHSKGIKKVEDTLLEDGKRFVTFEKDKGHQKTQWTFTLPKEVEDPFFSKDTGRIYLAINLYMLAEKTLNPYIPRGDLIKRLGGGKWLYGTIDHHIDFLTMATYKIEDKEKRTREIGHLIDYAKQYNVGTKGSYYYLRLSPEYHKHLKAIIEGKKGKELPPYVKYPVQSLLEYPKREKGIVNLILQHKGQKTIYPFSIKTLLEKGIGLSKKEIDLKSAGYFAEKLDQGLNDAKARGFEWHLENGSLASLKSFTGFIQFSREQLQSAGFKKGVIDKFKNLRANFPKEKKLSKRDFLKLKITFKEIKTADPPETVEDLTRQITAWHCQPDFKTKKLKEEVSQQVYNTVKKYGTVEVEKCFKNVTHPKDFWNRIKGLKKGRG